MADSAFARLPRLPDPLPEEIADHLTSLHGVRPGFVTPEYTHMLAHVRGEFTGEIHFHEKTGG